LYEDLAQAVADGEVDTTLDLVNKALEAGDDPKQIVEEGLAQGMAIIGEKYDKGDAFLVEVIVSAEGFKRSMELIRPHFENSDSKKVGTAVMGTVEGDIHDIGKNLVCVALEVSGFDVIDLGNDVAPETFSGAAKAGRADIIGMSTLITTTMLNMKNVIDQLVEDGVREDLKVICGGAPLDGKYVKDIGGDLFAPNAFEGAEVCKNAMGA
jgi:5-methyltetrahydrofolate--homocysteine methyltransferase